LAYFEKCQDLAWIATTQKHLGIIAGSQGKYELSRQWLKSARKQYQAIDDLIGLADTLSDLGNIAIGLGDFTEAKRLNQNCLVLRQKTNHLWGVGTSLNNLGYIALVQAEYDEARQLLEKSLDIQREIGDLYQIANSLSNLGQAAYGQRDLMPARNYYFDALTSAMKIGAHPLLLEIIVGIVQLDLIAGSIDLNRAAALLAFVGQHPACDQMTRERAEREFANLANSVPAADINSAEELAKTLELEALVLEMLG
jgi:tetratricopeptide (TPR) repeat protein